LSLYRAEVGLDTEGLEAGEERERVGGGGGGAKQDGSIGGSRLHKRDITTRLKQHWDWVKEGLVVGKRCR
jgi:hypothetical protein